MHFLTMQDPTGKAILRFIESLGYAVTLIPEGEQTTIQAWSKEGEFFEAKAPDDYRAACCLAELVGVDLEDG